MGELLFGGFVAVQLLSCVQLFETPQTAACQAPLSSTLSQGLLKFMSIELVVLCNHLILCRPLLLLPSIFSSIRVFCNQLAFCTWWSKYCSFSFSISPSNEYLGLISFRDDCGLDHELIIAKSRLKVKKVGKTTMDGGS